MQKSPWLLPWASLVLIAGSLDAEAFGAKFSWSGIPDCSNTSPAFSLNDVPAGTAKLRFQMIDLDKPSFKHGGSTIKYSGTTIARGAVSYIGPCPPPGEKHRYRWSVEALDAGDKVLGTTSVVATFPP